MTARPAHLPAASPLYCATHREVRLIDGACDVCTDGFFADPDQAREDRVLALFPSEEEE